MSLPDLPEPKYFTLEQICKRWSCEDNRLLQYCESGMLEIGVILDGSKAYQNDKFGRSDSILKGFYALSSGDVGGTMYWGESPGCDPEFSCEIKHVYLPKGYDQPYYDDFYDKEISIDPTFILNNRHVFASSSLVIEKTERDRFETEHNMHIGESIDNEDTRTEAQLALSVQEKRELILKGWLAGKELKQPLELTQGEIWEALCNIDSQIFRTASPDTIKQFFKKQTLCSFKTGRRRG